MSDDARLFAVKRIGPKTHGEFTQQLIALIDMVEDEDWPRVEALLEDLRRGAASKDRSARQAHSLKVGGSNPPAATASLPHQPESAPALTSSPARSSSSE